mgnify:CR=1 FL=1|jgi:hypothetical protein
MNSIKEDRLEQHTINFSNRLTEEYVKSFAFKVAEILKSMTTGRHSPVSVTGDESKIKSFAKALGYEERYIRALAESSAGDPNTMNLRHQLEAAIADFEKSTGIKWPVR